MSDEQNDYEDYWKEEYTGFSYNCEDVIKSNEEATK